MEVAILNDIGKFFLILAFSIVAAPIMMFLGLLIASWIFKNRNDFVLMLALDAVRKIRMSGMKEFSSLVDGIKYSKIILFPIFFMAWLEFTGIHRAFEFLKRIYNAKKVAPKKVR